ncbi:hypothetical protein QQF64_024582 [Cirrhinus molitorella]|uniref:Uncharacterized protein n=1 Tax=Cirrhinus molitorella TaxID=172907 RepID=A0ABR3NLX7_9TELE
MKVHENEPVTSTAVSLSNHMVNTQLPNRKSDLTVTVCLISAGLEVKRCCGQLWNVESASGADLEPIRMQE